nr:hypothetical protein [Sphingobacterium griseoflavum]
MPKIPSLAGTSFLLSVGIKNLAISADRTLKGTKRSPAEAEVYCAERTQ